MRGKRMRCPNTLCRAIFEVRDDNDPAPAAKETPEPGPAVTTEAWQAPVLPEPVPQAPPESSPRRRR
jgi:hypothetical protein